MRPTVFADGRTVPLGERIGKGGEGEVFAVADAPALAAKLYAPDGARRREAKIAAMVEARLGEGDPFVAFPRAVVRDAGGRFAGFLMPRVTGAEPLHELYAPGSRKQRFPEADYRFLVRAALNVARAVAATHAAGCVIGDVNHSGFLVARDARVFLIDADSFQFRYGGTLYPCHVGVPEYTPPELSGRPLGEVERTPNHDAFGVAVVVFQLLFMGRHPFAGVPAAGSVTVPEAIASHRFAWSRQRETGLAPPPRSEAPRRPARGGGEPLRACLLARGRPCPADGGRVGGGARPPRGDARRLRREPSPPPRRCRPGVPLVPR